MKAVTNLQRLHQVLDGIVRSSHSLCRIYQISDGTENERTGRERHRSRASCEVTNQLDWFHRTFHDVKEHVLPLTKLVEFVVSIIDLCFQIFHRRHVAYFWIVEAFPRHLLVLLNRIPIDRWNLTISRRRHLV